MLRLILPIIFPSWRFFNSIGPSPRIMLQFNLSPWQEFRPKPVNLGLWARLISLFYNPEGNKTLFLHSCAARLFDEVDPSALHAIELALAHALHTQQLSPLEDVTTLIWRVEQLDWDSSGRWNNSGKITASTIYTSEPCSIAQLKQLWRADSKLCR